MSSEPVEHPLDDARKGHVPIVRCVAGVLISDGRVLLTKRASHLRFYPDIWDLPGGHIEEGESPEDALRRELLEELQVEIQSFSLMDSILHPDPVEPIEIMVFLVPSWKGRPLNAEPDKHTEIGWFSASNLPASKTYDFYREVVVSAMTADSADSIR